MTTQTEEYYVDTLITHVDDKEIMWIEFKDDDSTEETICSFVSFEGNSN